MKEFCICRLHCTLRSEKEMDQSQQILDDKGLWHQRTLTVGGRIIVRLASSLTRLELTNEGNIILFLFSEAV